MKNTKHTETPWTLSKIRSGDKEITIPEALISIDYDDVDHDEQKANAEFVLRCVNMHDELLAALKAIDPRRIGFGQSTDMYMLQDAQRLVMAAIDNAESQ